MPDLATYIWMRQQWRVFRRLLIGALTAVLVLCLTGLVFLRGHEATAEGAETAESTPEWFYARLALLLLLGVASGVTVWLYIRATLEIRNLGRLAAEARLEEARQGRERRSAAKKGSAAS